MARDKSHGTVVAAELISADEMETIRRAVYQDIPEEVFQAVDGKPDALIALLRSEEMLDKVSREALALWLSKELPPKRSNHRPKAKRLAGDIPDAVWLEFAAQRYNRVAKWLGRRNRFYGRSKELISAIAKENKVTEDGLRNAIRSGPPKVPDYATDLPSQYLAWKMKRPE